MALDDLKERYKGLPIWVRLGIAVMVGLAPAAYLYLDRGDEMDQKLSQVRSDVDSNRQKFEDARKKRANLPKLEEQMEFTEEQLNKAKLKLPDNFAIEDILQKTATIAKQTGVQLTMFEPGSDVQHQSPYPYVELPINTEIVGRFAQVATFFDQMVHLEGSIFLRHLEVVRFEGDPGARRADNDSQQASFEAAKAARTNMKVKSHFDIVVFRSFAANEKINAAAEGAAPGAADGEKKKMFTLPKFGGSGGDAGAAAAAAAAAVSG